MTPKENYFRLLSGEIPEYIPTMFEDRAGRFNEELLTPQAAPDGPVVTSWGVRYVGAPDMNFGAMPDPAQKLLPDITKWRDYIKMPDLSGFDWEKYYTDRIKDIDRSQKYIAVGGGDYFLTLVSFMGFEDTLLALYEEPEEVKALLEYVSEFYLTVLKKQIYYIRPEVLGMMDDDSAALAPFFSVDMYKEFFKPFHKLHTDIAHENNMFVERHDCGKCEAFIPDWLDLGICSWNPAQTMNDLPGIKKKYGRKLAIVGGWDHIKYDNTCDVDELREALYTYVDTFAPDGGFVFSAMIGGPPDDPETKKRQDIVNEVYEHYAKDYYKTH